MRLFPRFGKKTTGHTVPEESTDEHADPMLRVVDPHTGRVVFPVDEDEDQYTPFDHRTH